MELSEMRDSQTMPDAELSENHAEEMQGWNVVSCAQAVAMVEILGTFERPVGSVTRLKGRSKWMCTVL
jgi:hypothetical protein